MKKIVVLGGGISGYGSAVLAKKKGFQTFLSDAGKIAERYTKILDEWGVEWEQGGHTMERILKADLVVKSPGIPEKAPVIKALRERGVKIVSEMEFAYKYLGRAKTICITGSNGKTTTTSLIYHIMRQAGVNVALGGNIGESFAYQVATADYDWYVLELSSFQLDGMYDFRADVGVCQLEDAHHAKPTLTLGLHLLGRRRGYSHRDRASRGYASATPALCGSRRCGQRCGRCLYRRW